MSESTTEHTRVRTRVAVIGGGLAGLTAAHVLAHAGARVTLLEAADRLGGQIHTERADGFVVEHGAEGFVAGSEAVHALCTRLGLEDQLADQVERRSLVLRDGTLAELPRGGAAGLLGFAVSASELGRGTGTLRRGMGQLIEALAADVESMADVRLACGVTELGRDGASWVLSLASGEQLASDAVILAAPGRAAASLVATLAPDTAAALARVPMASSVTVSLALPREAVAHPLDASGFVAAEGAERMAGLVACAFTSSKYADRAPPGWVLLRVFFRPASRAALDAPDREWCERAHRLLEPVLGLASPPERCWVARWPEALAQLPAGSDATMAAVQSRLAGTGVLALAGAFYGGRGIDGAARSGEDAARAVRVAPGVA